MCVGFGWRTFLFCGIKLCSIEEGEREVKNTTELLIERIIYMKKIICLLLVVITISTLFIPCGAADFKSSYKVGDTIEIGSYPQTLVTDSNLLAKLNSLDLNWISYQYYRGDEGHITSSFDSIRQEDYMFYSDVVFENLKYRAVRIDGYRPYATEKAPVHSNEWSYMNTAFQPCNGYFLNKIYWFKYEPLEWYVLNPNEGLLLAKKTLDCQPFSNYYGVESDDPSSWLVVENMWETSDIRKWLNIDFYNLAFDEKEKLEIEKSKIVSNIYLERPSCDIKNSKIISTSVTHDSVFLLSIEEAYNKSLGFHYLKEGDNPELLKYKSTDYSKCQGFNEEENNCCSNTYTYGNLLRDGCWIPLEVYQDGGCSEHASSRNWLSGIRPVIKLKQTFNNSCKCLCHSNNIFSRIILFIYKLFKINHQCKDCLAIHWCNSVH